MPSLPRTRKLVKRSSSNTFRRGHKFIELFFNSFPGRKIQEASLDDVSDGSSIFTTFIKSFRRKYKRKSRVELTLEDSPNFFDLLEKLQSGRLNDQRCLLPTVSIFSVNPFLEKILNGPSPYPMLVLPCNGGYWIECSEDRYEEYFHSLSNKFKANKFEWISEINENETALVYRKFFLGQKHSNFSAIDKKLGPILLSVKHEIIDGHEYLRFLLRRSKGTVHELIRTCFLTPVCPEISETKLSKRCIAQLVKILDANLTVKLFYSILCPQYPDLIVAYDEHTLTSTYKFGVVCQKKGQLTEQQLFSNQESETLDIFVQNLGNRGPLKKHTGYHGGLDTLHGLTGEVSVYDVFHSREIMFHVSTYLPYMESDPQQLEKKRHIGNDIVAIIFQEVNIPFSPDMITSDFLHVFIVVQVIEPYGPNTRYKVNVTARNDVPFFGPPLPNPPIFYEGKDFHNFLLTKLINAEIACYKAQRFSKLEMRTRESLLKTLVDELQRKSTCFLSEIIVPQEDNH